MSIFAPSRKGGTVFEKGITKIMKKRILALLLAGAMTVSLSACISHTSGEEDTTVSGTEINPFDPTNYEIVDDMVYATASGLFLYADPSNATSAIEIALGAAMHRTRTSAMWSLVEYNGGTYFIQNDRITNEDLLGVGFTACTPAKTMYATTKVNIRLYASANTSISPTKGALEKNEEVKVVAQGERWSKIELTREDGSVVHYFVNSQYLSSSPIVEIDYTKFFTPTTETTLYINAEESANLRSEPSTETGSILATKKKNETVILVATGTGDYADWRYVKVEVQKPGDPIKYEYCYAHKSVLSDTPIGGVTSTTLEDLLRQYPTFSAVTEGTMFVANTAASLSARTSPIALKDNSNVGAYLTTKSAVTVVAAGTANEVNWKVIRYAEGVFYFVSAKFLTTSSNGDIVLDLNTALDYYPQFKACTEETLAAKGTVNCYTAPETSATAAKQLVANTTVTLVAKDSTAGSDWCLIKTSDGAYYFVGYSLFTKTQG